MAEIIKRGKNRWLVRVFLGRDSLGKTRYHNKTVKGNKKAAQSYARDAETKHSLGILHKPEPVTLDTFLSRWLKDFKKPTVRERTFNQYTQIIDLHIRPQLGQTLLTELTARQIQTVYNALAERGVGRTLKYAHNLLSSALNQAVIEEEIKSNPALSTKRVPFKRKKIDVFEPEEANAFLQAAKADRYYVLFWFALATGFRPEEYFGLTWPNVNLDKCEARVTQTVFRIKGGGWRFEEVKTEASLRTIRFNKALAKALARHKREQNEQRLMLGQKYQNNQLVFSTSLGMPLQIRNLTLRHFRPILERAKLNTKMHLYCLRHSYATLSLLAAVDPKAVSASLGHTRVSFTLDTYQHLLPVMSRDAAERVGQMLFSSSKQ
jgi:integrase